MNLDDVQAQPTPPSLHQQGFTGSGYEYPDIKAIERSIKARRQKSKPN